jgi:transposase
MGGMKVVLQGKTVNKLNRLLEQFEKERNLGGILRIFAIKAFAVGDTIEKIADSLRTSEQTVRNWLNEFLLLGIRSIHQRKSPGRPKILTHYEIGRLKKILENPPEKYGFLGGCWDSKKIKHLIFEKFGKTLSVKYIPEILKSIGLSFRKARVEFGNKDDILRGIWVDKTWPRILATAEKQGAHIFFGDEAFFSVFGTTGYTWLKANTDAVVKSTGSKKNIGILGAINYTTGKTHALMTELKIDGDAFICYLKTLLNETRKPIHLIVDNARYHKSEKVKDFLRKTRNRLTIHYLPAYSPDYNPIEGLWKKLKKDTTHNVYFESIESLSDALIQGLQRFREQPWEVKALFGFYEHLG